MTIRKANWGKRDLKDTVKKDSEFLSTESATILRIISQKPVVFRESEMSIFNKADVRSYNELGCISDYSYYQKGVYCFGSHYEYDETVKQITTLHYETHK